MSLKSTISTALLVSILMTGTAMAQNKNLPEAVISAIGEALDDEYHAEAVYAAALKKYGDVRPFSNIIKAEQHHSTMLLELLSDYKVEAPENPYQSGKKSIGDLPTTVQEACAVGAEAEVANLQLYDEKLIPVASSFPDVQRVFVSLRDASEFKHLPAFQRCASGSKGQGVGKGQGKGQNK